METLPTTTNADFAAVAILQRRDGDDDRKARYLSLRACYFSVRECKSRLGIYEATLEEWRQDPAFYEADVEKTAEFQRACHTEALRVEHTRNHRLLIELDESIIDRALRKKKLSKFEVDYVKKIRSLYTPDQYDKLQALLTGQAPTNFAQYITFIQMQKKVGQQDEGLATPVGSNVLCLLPGDGSVGEGS